jgi:hypothetical protein
MSRRRLTWKKADNAPALPNEGYDHPADQGQQPVEKYFIDNDGNGVGSEPSDFAEDVHQPPYNKGLEPAIPHEGHDHPAMKQAARDIRASVERKASKCIRIAQATLGKTASIEDIEDQALAFMNMADEDVEATLDRMSEMEAYQMAEEPTATSMFAEEDEELEGMMAEFMAGMEADNHEGEQWAGEEEAMLAEMLAEEEMGSDDLEAEEMLSQMLAEDEAAEMMPMAEEAEEEMADELMLAEEGLDAMGLDDGTMADDELLAGLFAGKFAGEEEAEEEEAEEEVEAEEEEKESSKKASRLRPRARKASKGVQTLGNVSKTASSEMNELSKLWETAPNITDLF